MKFLTYTGKEIDLANISADDIEITDIAHSLSMLCRFNGQCNVFYSVAQHSIDVMQQTYETNTAIQRYALLHDAAEAYIGDMSRPLKKIIPDFAIIERTVENAIKQKFHLMSTMPEIVRIADDMVLEQEKQFLMGDMSPSTAGPQAFIMTQSQAKTAFMREFSKLFF